MFGQSCQCVKDSNKDDSLGFPWGGSVFILILTGLNKLGHSSLFWVACGVLVIYSRISTLFAFTRLHYQLISWLLSPPWPTIDADDHNDVQQFRLAKKQTPSLPAHLSEEICRR